MLFFYANPVLIAAAVLPAIFLLIQINKADKLDREPPGMILNLVFWGAVSTALAVYTERLGTTVLDALWPEDSLIYRLLMYFVVVGLSEEGFKYLLLRRHSWNSPFFNCQFDGVVYAVSVGLGFALWENIDCGDVRPGHRLGPGHYRRPRPRLLRGLHGGLLRHGETV